MKTAQEIHCITDKHQNTAELSSYLKAIESNILQAANDGKYFTTFNITTNGSTLLRIQRKLQILGYRVTFDYLKNNIQNPTMSPAQFDISW